MATPVKPLPLLDALPLPCESDGHWIAGFAAGEGSFCLMQRKTGAWIASFSIGLDPSDHMALQWMKDVCHGIGSIGHSAEKVQWCVQGWAACHYLVRLFDTYPLRAAKARDFSYWREGVLKRIAFGKSSAIGYDWDGFEQLSALLKAGRRGGLD